MSDKLKLLSERQQTRLKFFDHLKEDDDPHNAALRELAEERYKRMVLEGAYKLKLATGRTFASCEREIIAEIDAELEKKG